MGFTVMLRKRRHPAPDFRMPGAPFNPVTGQRAQMGLPDTPGTILATFQVIGDDPTDTATQDTHANYVVCRGYEPEIDQYFRYLHDPKTNPGSKSIKVAKPYGVRGTYPYKRGQIIVAARVATRFGFNQGKAGVSTGQPADLDEEVDLLFDDDNVAVSWIDLGSSAPSSPQTLCYAAYKPVQGFGTDDGNGTCVLVGGSFPSGYVGAINVCGDETQVGVSYDDMEATPSTNGNFLITKTGVFKIELTGYVTYSLPSAKTYVELRWSPRRKPDAGVMDDLTDSAGNDLFQTQTFYEEIPAGATLLRKPVSRVGYFYLTAGDRLTFKWTLAGSLPSDLKIYLNYPLTYFTYLQSENMLSAHASF